MNVTAKDLRTQPGKILKKVAQGQEVTVTYRGKKIVKLTALSQNDAKISESADGKDEIFGLWKHHDNSLSVEETVRQMRRKRDF